MIKWGLCRSGIVGLVVAALCVGAALADGDAPPVKDPAATDKPATDKPAPPKPAPTSTVITPSSKPPDSGPVEAASRQLQADQKALANAREVHKMVASKLVSQFEDTPEMKAALAAEEKAQSAYQAALDAVLARLQTQEDYKAAVAARDSARAKVDEVKRSGRRPDDLIAAANEAMNAGAAVSRLEDAAKEADPAFKTAQSVLIEAHRKVMALRDAFAKKMQSNEEWTKANKAVEEAQARVNSDQQQLNDAQKQYNTERAAYALYLQKKQEEERLQRVHDGGTIIIVPGGGRGGRGRGR
ncbi:MAG: hypothetical protein BIFFINMI_00889 [Phycisphaerae bacterium]|nr:hypothetical protein [Phycisphaerae bacterium]